MEHRKHTTMSSVKNREERRSFPVSSGLQNSTSYEETLEQQAAAGSPLINVIPKIPTEKIQSLVISFWNQIDFTELTKRESMKILTNMFMELITTITGIILESFVNLVLEGREKPPQVSEEVVRRAVCPSLFDCFKAALGSTHPCMTDLFNVVSEQVTNAVNSVLCCSRMKGEHLVISEMRRYRPPKDKMKTMIKHNINMLRSIKNQVNCGGRLPTKRYSLPAEHQEEETYTSTRRQSINQKLGRNSYIPQKHEENLDISTAHTEIHKLSPEQMSKAVPSIMSTGTVKEKRDPIGKRIKETLGQCHLCEGHSELQKSSASTEETDSIKTAIAEVMNILLTGGIELSGEEEKNLRNDSLLTASSIVNSITDEMRRIESEHGGSLIIAEQDGLYMTHFPCLTKKIKSFFTLCYAKASLRNLLSSLYISLDTEPYESLEEVIENISYILQQMINEEDEDVYQSLHGLIAQEEMSELLTGTISLWMVPAQNQPEFMDGIQMKVQTFMNVMSDWLHTQGQLPDKKNPVKRALVKIHKVVFKIFRPAQAAPRAQLTYEDQVPLPPQSINQEYVGSSEVPEVFLQPSQAPQEHIVRSHIVPKAMSDPLSGQWSKKYCNILVYEVVSRIIQEKMDQRIPLSTDLLAKLSENVSQWDVLVTPSKRICKKVASAVYKDLCKGQEEIHVAHAAFVQSDFSSDVLDVIRQKLMTPKKRCTLGSSLRSVCNAICGR